MTLKFNQGLCNPVQTFITAGIFFIMIAACSLDIKMNTYVFVVAKHVYVGVSCFHC